LGKGWEIEKGAGEYEVKGDYSLSGEEELVFSELVKRFQEGSEEDEWKLLKEICLDNNLLIQKSKAKKIAELASLEARGFGPFSLLLQDDSLEEIACVGVGREKKLLVYKRGKGWLETNCFLESQESAIDLINKMARPLGRRISYQFPRLNAMLPDGSRLHACIPPLGESVEVTLRKFRKEPYSIAEFVSSGALSPEACAFLWVAMASDSSVIISGNTGGGKTTLLNALLSFVSEKERIVITEETPELRLFHSHSVKMVANEELGISLGDLVKDTLRMRPDRVIVGEARDEVEVKALCDSLLSGQAKGTYATFHSDSAQEAIDRLRALGARREEINAIDLVIVTKRVSVLGKNKRERTGKAGEERRITEISEVSDGKAVKLFERRSNGKLERVGKSKLLEKIRLENFGFGDNEMKLELRRRETFLSELTKKGLPPNEVFEEIQGFD
jgi:Flp pilus assembly CpaF family ATPase